MNTKNLPKQHNLWFEKLMAIIATINLFLVFFDSSYIPWRNFYLQRLPQIIPVYDQVKGIEPHRETEYYLKTVNTLTQQVSETGLRSPQVEAKLDELRRLSTEMIDTNPFAVASKTGTLAKIKDRMRNHIHQESAKRSFAIFWSQSHLSQKGWNQEINFFNNKITPLIKTNYFRQIGENGQFLDYFWLIDLPFVLLFGVEILARSFYNKRRHPSFSWLSAILWRWYDLFLLLPFWRWLRIIPVLIRLDQAKLLSLQSVRQLVHHGVIANFAEELTEIVVIRVINQIQGSIQRGELIRGLLQKQNQGSYIDINDENEIEAIASILGQTIVNQVLPKIQPDITAILLHNIERALNLSPIYRNLQTLPIVGQIPTQISEQLADQITTTLYSILATTVEDPVSAKLVSQLMQSLSKALGEEIQQKYVVSEIQRLLLDFLEEVKLNYIQNLSREDIGQILEQTRQIRSQESGVRSQESGVRSQEIGRAHV